MAEALWAAWPFLLAAACALLWLALLGPRIERKLQFVLVAFLLCAIASLAVEFVCAYLVPLDIAGTPPPDPRNARLRFLITAAAQAAVALALSGYLAVLSRVRRER
jgi:hypothetical protein